MFNLNRPQSQEMLTAAIYVQETDNALAESDLVHAGIDPLASLIGGVRVVKESFIDPPPLLAGSVVLNRRHIAAFDPEIDFHIIVGGLEGESKRDAELETIGLAVARTGIVYSSNNKMPLLSSTVTHELAHLIGFVLPDSPRLPEGAGSHCNCESCVMAPKTQTVEGIGVVAAGGLGNNVDFCGDCRTDVVENHLNNIAIFRRNKLRQELRSKRMYG